jgi:hypothetical protein
MTPVAGKTLPGIKQGEILLNLCVCAHRDRIRFCFSFWVVLLAGAALGEMGSLYE